MSPQLAARLVLINVSKRLSVVVAHNKAGGLFRAPEAIPII
jgi:hypothetical protein